MRQFVTNERGERTGVLLSVEEYERLLDAAEEVEDQRAHDEALAEMERTGARPRPLDEVAREIEHETTGEVEEGESPS